MATPENLVVIYKELADWHERQGQPKLRDQFLVLAADAALSAGRPVEANLLLARLLRSNPHHTLKPFASFAEAAKSPDVQTHLAELHRAHPPAQAERQFDELRARRAAAPTTANESREPLQLYRVRDEDAARLARPAPQRPRIPADREEPAQGAWLSAILFVILLVPGLALAAWIFLRPFLHFR
jgi:hypothetical protein